MTRQLLGEASFAVSARVAMQLGRESISNSKVAILELVKNAYDADAESVSISFADLESDHPIMVIEDDGTGMDRAQLENGWLVIGTDSKRQNSKSAVKKRTLTGEKGLGRLGLDRLCSRTIVQTFTRNEEHGIELEIDWTKYEDSSDRLESITHNYYSIPIAVPHPLTGKSSKLGHGTRLILSGLQDDWSEDMMRELRAELGLLVSPFGEVDDFSIFFDSGMSLPDIDGRVVSAEGLQAAEWRIASTLYEADGEYMVKHEMTSPVHDAVFTFGPEPWSGALRQTGSDCPRCGPLHFKFYFIQRTLSGISLTRSQIASFLEANQGIRIYRDDFRVKPYGEPSGEGDWLNLSFRRTQNPGGVKKRPIGSWRLGYNQVVGAVFISRQYNAPLLDQTNREGIVEGASFRDLKLFALHAIRYFETNRQQFEIARGDSSDYEQARETAQQTSDESLEAVDQLRESFEIIRNVIGQDNSVDDTREMSDLLVQATDIIAQVEQRTKASKDAQEELMRASEEQQEELQRQKDTLGNLASLGILAAVFGHETLAAANLVQNNALLLRLNIDQLMFPQPELHADILANTDDITAGTSKIETFAKFTLANVARDKRTRTKMQVEKVTKEVISSFTDTLEREGGITVQTEFEDNLPPILAFRIDWESVIVNFITNSIWALENTPRAQRLIRVQVYQEDEVLHFLFADSGCGIEIGTENLIFAPTFSTKRNERGDVIGTGMGLAIVENLITSSHGGTVDVESPCDLGGAEFHVQIPIPRLQDRGEN